MVGLGSVDDTTDAAKPISTATQDAIDTQVGKTYQKIIEVIRIAVDSEVNAAYGNWQELTLPGSVPLTFVGFPAGKGFSVMVDLTFAGFTPTYTNISKWVGGAEPGVLAGTQRFNFTSTDGGTTIVGNLIGELA
jgi:hypothetical protein